MKCTCPECARSFSFDETKYNKPTVAFKCPGCGGRIVVTLSPADTGKTAGAVDDAASRKGALSDEEVDALKRLHREAESAAIADAIKAVLFLHDGMSPEQAARLLMMKPDDVEAAWRTYRAKGIDCFAPRFSAASEVSADDERELLGRAAVDAVRLEIGYELVPMLDQAQGGTLLERIGRIRTDIASTYGWTLGPVRVIDNMRLGAREYRILVNDVRAASGEVQPGKVIALQTDAVKKPIDAPHAPEPVFGLPSLWLPADKRAAAEGRGYTVSDPDTVIATHLTEVVVGRAGEIVGLREVNALLASLRERNPDAVAAAESAPGFSPLALLGVVRDLLSERVGVGNLDVILEALAASLPETTEARELTRRVRIALGRQIVEPLLADGVLRVCILPNEIEDEIGKVVAEIRDERELTAHTRDTLVNSLQGMEWAHPVVMTFGDRRRLLRLLLGVAYPHRIFTVIAEEEVPYGIKVRQDTPFVFEDVLLLDDASIKKIIDLIDRNELAMALKGCETEVMEKFFRNFDEDDCAEFKEEMDFMGPVRLREVEAAQRAIVKAVLQLKASGDIVEYGSGDDELVV